MSADSLSMWYLMVKPRQGHDRLQAFAGADPSRTGPLAHCTVLPLGEGFGPVVPAIAQVLDEIDLMPFRIDWDRLVSTGSHLMLKASRPPADIARLRRYLRKYLRRIGVVPPGKSSDPHVTLNYSSAEPAFDRIIEPMSWLIDEVLLIESRIGKKQHVTHARFPIRPRQGMLFPLMRCSVAPRHSDGEMLAPAC